jgi:LemA protein
MMTAMVLAQQGMSSGTITLIVAGGVLLVILIWVVGIYNSLVRVKNAVDESWSGIDTELRRRYDLIPNLVETVKGYATHEKDTLERVIQARNVAYANHGSPEAQAKDENVLVGAMRQLFAIAEQYPDLKANANFAELQKELANTEDRIQRSRRFYNANVRDLNNRVELFPSNIIAGLFGFTKREYFEIEEAAARQPVAVKF